MQAVQALAALGRVCQVLLLVHNPCRYYWGDVVEGHAALRAQVRRRQPLKPTALATAAVSAPPLLAALGKQGRDYLHLLDGFDEPERYRTHWSRIDVFVDPAKDVGGSTATPSQLAQLQSDILNLNPPPSQPVAQPDDGSLVFVTAHSVQRELEVLHDRLLAWLEADPSLQPSDVMVMVPDMAVAAPHIHAVFGRVPAGQPCGLPYAVADLSPRQSPLVLALEQLLNLPEARLSLGEALSLFEVAAVRTRFGLSQDDVRVVQDWLQAAGVRWGLDGAHRTRWGVPPEVAGLAQNTWAFGLRRLLLGYALGEADDGLWQGTLAQPALGGLDAPLIGAVLQWLQAVEDSLPLLRAEHTPDQWCATLRALVARFFASDNAADERAIAQLLEPLEAWQAACAQAQCDVALPLAVVREHWLSQLAQTGLRQRFFGGGVQFGTLMPMRAIPFKVICLLGMNDGAYPRAQAPRDFDLMAQSWRAGDRSRREDDRYLFLEAMLSARQKLYVSWQGRRATDNTEQPPSVLVAQLLDAVNACWTPAHEPQAQPLQPFSRAYFEAGSPFESFAADWAPVWQAADPDAALADDAPVLVPAAAPQNVVQVAQAASTLTLEQLERLLRQPVEVFIRQQMRVELDDLQALEQDDEPFALDHLQQYQAGQTLLRANADASALAQLQATGNLPMSGFGQRLALDLTHAADRVIQARARWLERYPVGLSALAVQLAVGTAQAPCTLTGTLRDLFGSTDQTTGSCLQLAERTGVVLAGSKTKPLVKGHQLVRLWVRHLAGCAMGLELTSVQLGVDGEVVFVPLPAPQALRVLKQLADVYAQACRQLLPVACKTALAYLQAEINNSDLIAQDKPPKDPHDAAETAFDGDSRGENSERDESTYLQRAFDSYADLADGLPTWAPVLYADLLQQARPVPGEA